MKAAIQPQIILMLDTETTGTSINSCVSQVSLLAYDLEEDEIITSRHFEFYPIIPQQRDKNRVVDAATFLWWMQQSDDARKAFDNSDSEDGDEIPALLRHLSITFERVVDGRSYEIWANAPSFDCNIMKSLYRDYGMDIPWDFRKERCLRTICANAGIDPKTVPPVAGFTPHNAYWDCRQQLAIYLEARKAMTLST